jgi:hypothetical protein
MSLSWDHLSTDFSDQEQKVKQLANDVHTEVGNEGRFPNLKEVSAGWEMS